MYKILDKINSPEDLKVLSLDELNVLAIDIRQFLIESVSKTGGHLSSSLGVVDLTIALHYCFDSPKDKIIWDVGHQAYVHKLLTGRKDRFHTLRQYGGLSGFLKRSESPHDIFEAGHSSTSISSGIGMALARDLKHESFDVVSVIGDGALTGGMALEALNFLGHEKCNMKVILNDNEMSISENVGGIAKALSHLRTTESYAKLKGDTKSKLSKIPSVGDTMIEVIGKLKDTFKYFVVDGGYFFEELGLTYIGPINGHSIEDLIESLEMIKHVEGPVLLHVLTQKGKGYANAELNPNQYHGVGKFDPCLGIESKEKHDYSYVFGKTMSEMVEEKDNIVAITAAMITGTGLTTFAKEHPDKLFDVGIAEQHAVTMAAGMALEGIKPYVAIYSTFMQRAYDQILHDVCLHKAPVVFCIDRAGLVGNDGETHHGVFDIAYLAHMPNMMILSPKDEQEFIGMLHYAYTYQEGPIAIRYPRGDAYAFGQMALPPYGPQVLKEHSEAVVVATGKMTEFALEACERTGIGLIHMPKLKPLDETQILSLLKDKKVVITLEDHTVNGGLGDQIGRILLKSKKDISRLEVFETLGIQDEFVPHGNTDELYKQVGIDVENIIKKINEVYCG